MHSGFGLREIVFLMAALEAAAKLWLPAEVAFAGSQRPTLNPSGTGLRFRVTNVITASQEGFMLVRRVDAQGALLVGSDVFPGAFFENQLSKGFP